MVQIQQFKLIRGRVYGSSMPKVTTEMDVGFGG